MKTIILIASLSGLLIGCSASRPAPIVPEVIYKKVSLSLPVRPQLPTLTSAELSCLPPDIKIKLRDRELLRKNYIEELETIIHSTNN